MNLDLPSELDLLEERLREFFQGMLYKLAKNSHKKTPEIHDIPAMKEMLLAEVDEFADQYIEDPDDANTLIELFDTANFAFLMFLALRNRGHADWRMPTENLLDKGDPA